MRHPIKGHRAACFGQRTYTGREGIRAYINKYIYIKLSTVALKIPHCSGKVRGACVDLVSCLERA